MKKINRIVSYLTLAKNILRSNVSRLDYPYKLTFAITYRCNYKCKTCNIWQRKPENELTLDEIGTFFRRSNKFNWVDFTGGEVWLRSDFTEIVRVALKECHTLGLLHFPTNGYMTDRIVVGVEQIMRMRPPKFIITVSMDGDEVVNDYVRGIKGGWRRQIETYKRLRAIPGVEVVLGMTLSSYNADQYERAFAAAKAACPWLSPRDFHMNVAHESSHLYGNEGSGLLDKNREEVVRQVGRYRLLRGFSFGPVGILERRYLKHVEKFLDTKTIPMRCHALSSSCFIDPWGNVYPCGMYDVKIASLRDYDFNLQNIWDLPRTLKTQKEIWDYRCPQCWSPCEAYQSIFGNLFGHRNTHIQIPQMPERST